LRAQVEDTWLIIHVNVFQYDLLVSQGTSVTDRQTDDNHANSSTVT